MPFLPIVSRSSTPQQVASRGRWRTLLSVLALATVAAATVGCSRGVATTTVHADGSWVRTVTFHGMKSGDGSGIHPKQSLSETFVLPSGDGWKVHHADTKDEEVIVAERTLAAGEAVRGDLAVYGDESKSGDSSAKPATSVSSKSAAAKSKAPSARAGRVMSNAVSVRQVSPGVWEYRETFHWLAPVQKDSSADADLTAAFKKALPAPLATDANARDLAKESMGDIWRMLFGPGEPLLAELSTIMTEPELVERRVQQQMGSALEQHLQARFAGQLTAEQRHAIVVSVIKDALVSVSSNVTPGGGAADSDDKKKDAKKDDDNPSPTASLFVSVKLPGRLTATNGMRDPVTGEAYWALYPEAALLGDVTLTATCDTRAPAAAASAAPAGAP